MDIATWGDNSNGLASLPAGLGLASAVTTGEFHDLALQDDGHRFRLGRRFKRAN